MKLNYIIPLILIGTAHADQFTYNDLVSGRKALPHTPTSTSYSYSTGQYSQKYDSTFGMGLKGVYAWATEDYVPDLGGALLDLHSNIETGDVVHEISFNFGYFGSPSPYKESYTASPAELKQLEGILPFAYAPEVWDVTAGAEIRNKIQSIPLLLGYTVNFPIVTEKVYLFLGVKAGMTYSYMETTAKVYVYGKEIDTQQPVHYGAQGTISDDTWDFTYTFTAGVRIALSQSVDAIIGYEYFKIRDTDPFHAIEAGLSWTF